MKKLSLIRGDIVEEKKAYYAVIPATIRYDKYIKANAKLLYGEITALCNEKGYCWATNAYFAELYGVSKNTISVWINQLIKKGYLFSEIKYKEGTNEIEKRYLKLNEIPITKKIDTPITKNDDTYHENNGKPITKNLKDNNTINNNKKEKSQTEFDQLINSYSENQKIKNTIYEFIKHRKSIKAALTTLALKKILNKLDTLAKDDDSKIAILENSIMNGWRGIFPLGKDDMVIPMRRNETPTVPIEIDKSKLGGI